MGRTPRRRRRSQNERGETEDREFRSLNTDYAENKNQSGIEIPTVNQTLQSQRSTFAWDKINWADWGEPQINGDNYPNGEAGFASLIHGPTAFDNPIDEWYVYWSEDSGQAIRLHTTDSLWSEWTEYGIVFDTNDHNTNQIATPWVIIDPNRDRVNLYYHYLEGGGRQPSSLATADGSGDGTSFTRVIDEIANDNTNAGFNRDYHSYFKCVNIGGIFYGAYFSADGNGSGIGTAWSRDGEYFVTEGCAFGNRQWQDYDAQGAYGGFPTPVEINNEVYLLYSDYGTGNSHALRWEDRLKSVDQSGDVVYSAPDWDIDNRTVVFGDWAVDDGHLVMIYHLHETGGGKARDIGMARVPLGEVSV